MAIENKINVSFYKEHNLWQACTNEKNVLLNGSHKLKNWKYNGGYSIHKYTLIRAPMKKYITIGGVVIWSDLL